MTTKLRVLIADDKEECRWAMENLLSSNFELVGTVGDGSKLVRAAMSLLPDVIVSDISMPALTGLEAMEELRRNGYEIPFVLVGSDDSGVEDCLERGASAFVSKIDMGHDLASAVFSVALREIRVSRTAECTTFQCAQV